MADRLIQSLHGLQQAPVPVQTLADLVTGMNYGGMISSAEGMSDCWIGGSDDLPGQVHRDLAG